MPKFIHCADLHIGKSRDFPNYLERQSLMLDAIFQAAKDKSDGLVVIGGDIYDCAVLRPREKDLFIEKLCQADKDGITTVVVNGNHDIIDQLDNGYTHLRTVKNLVEADRLKNTVCVEFNPEGFYLEKFKMGISAIPALYRKTKEITALATTHASRLRELHGKSTPIVAVVHETIAGSVNDTGHQFEKGITITDPRMVTYWALGDVHACQQITGSPNAYYSGCPIQHDFSDSTKRGVLVVDTNKPEDPEFYPLHHKVQRLITIVVGKDDDPSKVEIPRDAIVRIEATKQQLSEMYVPDNVVRTKVVNSKQIPTAIRPVGLDDAFDGLVDILVEMGLPEAGQQFCTDLARKLQ